MKEHMKSLVLLIALISPGGALEVKESLSGAEGGNITLPDPVDQLGFLSRQSATVAIVKNKEIVPFPTSDTFRDRILWDRNSGLFTIRGLQKTDSGIYTVDSKETRAFLTSYRLTVYDSVAIPAVQTLSVSSDSCYLLCAVDEAAEITLWWYKDQEVVNQSSSAGSLPLTVTKQDLNSSYRCVAGNPAENKTLLVDLHKVCGENFTNSSSENNHRHGWIIFGIRIVCVVSFFTLAACFIKFVNKKTTTEGQGEK